MSKWKGPVRAPLEGSRAGRPHCLAPEAQGVNYGFGLAVDSRAWGCGAGDPRASGRPTAELGKFKFQVCPPHVPLPRPVLNFIFLKCSLLKQDFHNYLSYRGTKSVSPLI